MRRIGPTPNYTREFQWIRSHRDEFAGQYVAVRGDQLIAHHEDPAEVTAALERMGFPEDVCFMGLPRTDFVPEITSFWSEPDSTE
jgi:hypothetical protein